LKADQSSRLQVPAGPGWWRGEKEIRRTKLKEGEGRKKEEGKKKKSWRGLREHQGVSVEKAGTRKNQEP